MITQTTPSPIELAIIEQVDRIAAWNYANFGHAPDSQERERWHSGYYDDQPVGAPIRSFAAHRCKALAAKRVEARSQIINTPETADFMAGVPIEAAHQRERWGVGHDAGKSPFDWFWLIGYLSQKAADAAVRGDADKAMHHTISTAAALANWHAALDGRDN